MTTEEPEITTTTKVVLTKEQLVKLVSDCYGIQIDLPNTSWTVEATEDKDSNFVDVHIDISVTQPTG